MSKHNSRVRNIDNSGLQEIIISRGAPSSRHLWQEIPWRHYVSIYAWNGVSGVTPVKRGVVET